MPRKQRAGKSRRATGWSIESLHPLFDVLTLHGGRLRPNSIHRGVRIQTREDARYAWQENKHLFMVMCTCHKDKPCCPQHEYAYEPGHRAWAYWYFDLHYPGIPDGETVELERLGLITETERKAMRILSPIGDNQPEAAEIKTFPKQEAD